MDNHAGFQLSEINILFRQHVVRTHQRPSQQLIALIICLMADKQRCLILTVAGYYYGQIVQNPIPVLHIQGEPLGKLPLKLSDDLPNHLGFMIFVIRPALRQRIGSNGV